MLATAFTLLLNTIGRRYNLDKIVSLNETKNGKLSFPIYVFSFNFAQIKAIRNLKQGNF